METKGNSVSIQVLPEEVLRYLAQFLAGSDLDVCSDVCKIWRFVFNSDKIWKRCCIFSEKYFKADTEFRVQECTRDKTSSLEMCTWRQYYKLEKSVCENWLKGNFSVSKTGICIPPVPLFSCHVDDNGNHWLFNDDCQTGISVWDITRTTVSYGKMKEVGHYSFCIVGDKLATFRTDYVKVFQFAPQKHDLNLLFSFMFEMDTTLPKDDIVPESHYTSGARYILVDHFFIGYYEDVTNIYEVFLHVWDLNSGKKITTINAFQQSFADYVKSKSQSGIRTPFLGGIVLFPGSSRRFLVNLIDDTSKLCQISLFSLDDMKFVNVITQVQSRTAWCFMKGDVITVFHLYQDKTSVLSVFNANGEFLGKLDFSGKHNPSFSDEFQFSGSKVILKRRAEKEVHVLSIYDSMEVRESSFETAKGTSLLGFYDPKFLLMFDKPDRCSEEYFSAPADVTVWDVESGLKLWTLENLVSLISYRALFNQVQYPRQVIAVFKGDVEMSILNFENSVTKSEHIQQQ